MESFDHMFLQAHATNKTHCISTTRVPMATKLGRMMTYLDGLQLIKPYDPLITCRCEIKSSLTRGGSARRRLSRHRLHVFVCFVIFFQIKRELVSNKPFIDFFLIHRLF